MVKIPLVFILLFSFLRVQAQQSVADSLFNSIKNVAGDTSNVITLNLLAERTANSGNLDRAIGYAATAIQLAQKINYKRGVAHGYSDLGLFYTSQGNNPEALKNYYAALRTHEEINNQAGIASTYGNIGNLYLQQQNFPEALLNYQAALKILKKTNNRKSLEALYINMGSAYSELGNKEEALRNYTEALSVSKEINDTLGIAYTYGNIGLLYSSTADYGQALKNYQASLQILEKINDKPGIATGYINLGKLYILLHKYSEAKDYLNKGLVISRETEIKNLIKGAYLELSQLDSATGNYKSAYENYRLYYLVTDSMLNEESTKQISQLKIQFETKKKDNEITLLNKNKELQEAEIDKQRTSNKFMIGAFLLLIIFASITFFYYYQRRKTLFNRQVSEVEMKALRAQMNPHFIFNSLNSIHRYMGQHDIDNASEYLIKFSRLMRLILENSRHKEVPVNSDLEALELYMQLEAVRLNNKFAFEIHVAKDVDAEYTLIPPLILQPFVENAIWHGLQYKEGLGKIIINISKKDNMLYCSVEDNGIGRKQSGIMSEKDKVASSESLGMKITNARIEIINKLRKTNANVKLVDLAQGLRVEIELPLTEAY